MTTIDAYNIIRKTTEQVEHCYALAQTVESASTLRTLFDQAFGMISLASVLIPTDLFDELADLWDEYKPKFETLIYGE